MSTLRDSHVEHFGEAQTVRIEVASDEHDEGPAGLGAFLEGLTVDPDKGDDPFRWAISMAVGHQCVELERYRAYHGITIDFEEWKVWVREHADLANYSGGDMAADLMMEAWS